MHNTLSHRARVSYPAVCNVTRVCVRAPCATVLHCLCYFGVILFVFYAVLFFFVCARARDCTHGGRPSFIYDIAQAALAVMPSPSSSSSAVSAEEVQALRLQIAAMQAGAETSNKQLTTALSTSSGWQRKTAELEAAAAAQNQRYTKLLTVRYEFITVVRLL